MPCAYRARRSRLDRKLTKVSPKNHPSLTVSDADEVIGIRVDDAEKGGNTGIEEANLFVMNERQKLLDLVVVGDELDCDSGDAGQLEEALLVHRMVSPETANGAKRAAARNTNRIGLFEQPLPEQNPLVTLLLNEIEPE